MPLLEPESLSHGHYECRSLDETLPVFTDLLASEVVRREDGAAVVPEDFATLWDAFRTVLDEGDRTRA